MGTPLILPWKIDLIWNHTRVCGFNCDDCCVAAIHAKASQMSAPDLSRYELIEGRPGESRYAAAQRVLQARGLELTYDEKLQVLENLAGLNVRVDISGGDALITPDGLPLLEAAAARVGRKNVTLTVTGMRVLDEMLDRVAASIAEFNFTFNSAAPSDAIVRPSGYAEVNLRLAGKIKAKGVTSRAECPLTRKAAEPEHLKRLYSRLADEGIETLLIMRQFPIGRGRLQPEQIPSRTEYLKAIMILRGLEAQGRGPRVKLQCALRHLEVIAGNAAENNENPCDLGRESYGLMADGTLLASPWAMNEHGRPLADHWVIGNLARQPLTDLLGSAKAQTFIRRSNENHGQCKIFAAMHSHRDDPLERVFDKTDPLYADAPAVAMIAAE
jgi:MoaA/NifB/PqqE/SkfB family radical SAM enzyme